MALTRGEAAEKQNWLGGELKKAFNKGGITIALGLSLEPGYDFAVRIQGGGDQNTVSAVESKIKELIPESNPRIALVGPIKAFGQ